jgi:ketosteroid isomerase-like protein
MFADAINHQNLDKVSELMAEEHVFIDSLGMRIEGRAAMRQSWAAYFRMVPDYTITIQDTLVKGPTVVMLGTAQGTYSANGVLTPKNRWSTPAAWRALICGSLVAEWQVYADNEPIRQIMTKNRK